MSREAFYAQLRANVRELLEKSGMTQKQLAKEMGMPYSTLNKKMRGVSTRWSAVDFASVYGVFGDDPTLLRGLYST
ncbi:helix-turn-helix transcriptional regulator [Microbacterium sp. CCNWLW134]|uniref:helix-turn-helix domain-containing protein n=1 Tax=Microbacterium sp. CCNWLW134 TaxID=3122064 RepID=UPI00300FBD8E